ncbi:MAG: AraC family transcriptional regulator [Cyanobacteria bacterium P01_E01_bin.35]
MKLVIPRVESDVDFEELYLRYGITFDITGLETRLNWSSSFALGFIDWTQVKKGLQIQFDSFQPRTNLVIASNLMPADPLQFNFYLSGSCRGNIQDRSYNLEFFTNSGQSLLFYGGADTIGTWESLPHKNLQAIEILIEPWLLQALLAQNPLFLPQQLQQIIAGESFQPYYQLETLTSAMQMTVHQILHCDLQGSLKQFYLETKAIELIILKLAQIQDLIKGKTRPQGLKASDIDRIYHAREILLQQMDNPPSLMTLAKLVGLNDYKLKLGFRHCFDTTVFGYLRSQRLEKARQLLVESELTVSEIALVVGYSSLSRFGAAFKRQFGINPSACRR